jgi:hypothetical protein
MESAILMANRDRGANLMYNDDITVYLNHSLRRNWPRENVELTFRERPRKAVEIA